MFHTLVNPEQDIPLFITRLTGITNEMVSTAPTFHEIAPIVSKLTKDCIFVAHNVAFDYGMLRNEYLELGMDFYRQLLCTVKSSRRLIPGHKSYSLGTFCRELGIEISQRHRALGDAEATFELFRRLWEDNRDSLLNMIEEGAPRFTGDPHTDGLLRNVPESTGVYYLHDRNNDVIYVGSGTNIRKKVLHHLTKYRTRISFELRNSIAEVSFEVTGSELLSLLIEASEMNRLKPIYNRRMRRRSLQGTPKPLASGLCYIIDKGPDRFTRTVIRVSTDQVGWGYFPAAQQVDSPEEFDLFIKYTGIGADYRFLIAMYLGRRRVEKIIGPLPD